MSEIKTLIEDYERRISSTQDLLSKNTNTGSLHDERRQERLKTKISEYRSFITDLEKILALPAATQERKEINWKEIEKVRENRENSIEYCTAYYVLRVGFPKDFEWLTGICTLVEKEFNNPMRKQPRPETVDLDKIIENVSEQINLPAFPSQEFRETWIYPFMQSAIAEGRGMSNLKAVEVCEIGQIKVNGIKGQNIIDAGKECIHLMNLLKVAVQLYWNGKYIDVYKGTTIGQIIEKSQQD